MIGQIRQRCWCETTWGWHLDGGNDRRYEKTGKTAGIRKKSGVRMPALFEPAPFFWGSHLKRPSIKLRNHFDNNYLIGALEHVLIFHSVGNVIIPTDELHHFSEGWPNMAQPPTSYARIWDQSDDTRMSPDVPQAVAPLSSTQRSKKSRSSKTIKSYRGHEDWNADWRLISFWKYIWLLFDEKIQVQPVGCRFLCLNCTYRKIPNSVLLTPWNGTCPLKGHA